MAERLRAQIVAGELPSGSKLRQVEIARRFGVSTTPVREALAALQREGLVRLHPQRGAVVFVPTVADLREHGYDGGLIVPEGKPDIAIRGASRSGVPSRRERRPRAGVFPVLLAQAGDTARAGGRRGRQVGSGRLLR